MNLIIILAYIISTVSVFQVWDVFRRSRNGELRLRMERFFFWLLFAFSVRLVVIVMGAMPDFHVHPLVLTASTLVAVTPVTIHSFCLAKFLTKYYDNE